MSEELHEQLTHDEIKQRLRGGYQFHPTQPGLQEAARQLIRPIVEAMEGREIIYECRVPKLMRVDYLETDDQGFRAVATPLNDLGCRVPTIAETVALNKIFKNRKPTKEGWWAAVNALPPDTKPLDFGARWFGLRMRGSAICMYMITDCFYPDPTVVAAVKATLTRNAFGEVAAILMRAGSQP